MNVELLEKIYAELRRLQNELTSMQTEYSEISNKSFISNDVKIKKLQILDKRIEGKKGEIKAVEKDFILYKTKCDKLKETEEALSSSQDQKATKVLSDLVRAIRDSIIKTEEELNKRYQGLLNGEVEKKKLPEPSDNKQLDGNKKLKNNIKRLLIGGISAFTLFVAIRLCSDKSLVSNGVATPEPTATTTSQEVPEEAYGENEPDNTPAPEEAYGEDEIEQNLTPEEVETMANEIFEENFEDTYETVLPNYSEEELVEMIENIIYVNNGELPLDENGKEYYNPSITDDYVNGRVDLFGNYPSSPKLDEILEVNYSDLTTDGTDLHAFMESYDILYNKIAKARNENNFEEFVKHTKELGKNLYNHWVLQGAHTGINPYRFKSEEICLAFGAATDRFASYVTECEYAHQQTICVAVCMEHTTGEIKKIPVQDIFDAIFLGKSNDASLAFGTPDGYQVIGTEFFNDLERYLEFKYNDEIAVKGLRR